MDILLNTLHTSSYVGSLFVLPSARTGGNRVDPKTGRPLTRDTPHVLRARLVGVGLSSLMSLGAVATLAIQKDQGAIIPSKIVQLLGLWKANMTAQEALQLATLPLAWTMSLFLGPLYTSALDGRLPGLGAWSWRLDIMAVLKSLRGLRNYVIGPITEELVFRSCIIGTAAMYGRNKTHMVFLTPLYFGIAHAHHAYEVYVNGGRSRKALQQGVFSSLFQFAYTSLFGFHAAFLFIRTGSVIPSILSHIFCNIMGFPHIADAIHRRPSQKYFIIAAYIAGIAAFAKGLWPLTDPSRFGGSLFW